MLNFSNISYVRCLHVSLIINTFAAVVGLYIRDRTFFFPHFYCAFILLSYLWESIFNFSFMKKYFPIPLIIILWIGLSLWSCNQPLGQKEKSSATFDSIQVEKTYHLLENPEYPNCNLVLNFTYFSRGWDKPFHLFINHFLYYAGQYLIAASIIFI